ncbi:MAG: hypothetical protein U0T11_01390 [Chitinophagaceae bacterium]
MSYLRFLPAVATFLLISACTVSKQASSPVYKGKLLAAYCAFYVVEIQNPDVFEEGIDWRTGEGTIISNAFTIGNFCDFSGSSIKVGDTFEYQVLKDSVSNNCMVCLGYLEAPSLYKNIRVVKQ